MSKGTGIWHCDTLEEYENHIQETEENPDFQLFLITDSIQEIYDEMEYQGFSEAQTEALSHNRYGDCLEIFEYQSSYTAYIGAR